MSNIRHVVVVRTDLRMSEGLLASQVAHICDAFMRQNILKIALSKNPKKVFNADEISWISQPYLSVLAVHSYEDLIEVKGQAEREGLPIHCWKDLVPSPTVEGKSIRAFVGLSIGPSDFDAIKIVTGALPLY